MKDPSVIDPWTALAIFVGVIAVGLLMFWPRVGAAPRLVRAWRARPSQPIEDALKQIFHATVEAPAATVESLAGALEVPRDRALEILAALQRQGLVRAEGVGVVLTEPGRAYALRVLRSHRLVERYLADRTGVRPEDWHAVAEEREHQLSAAEVESLAARLGQPRFDPHGDPIPTAEGELPPPLGLPLSALRTGEGGTIVHVEDEPRDAHEALRTSGFVLGRSLVVRSDGPVFMGVEIDGREVTLPRVLAPGVTVAPHEPRPTARFRTLASLAAGESGRVVSLSTLCRGAQRRRLLDLGIVPGTVLRAELIGIGGDPVAYRVRGALIALRRPQADWIEVEPATGPDKGASP